MRSRNYMQIISTLLKMTLELELERIAILLFQKRNNSVATHSAFRIAKRSVQIGLSTPLYIRLHRVEREGERERLSIRRQRAIIWNISVMFDSLLGSAVHPEMNDASLQLHEPMIQQQKLTISSLLPAGQTQQCLLQWWTKWRRKGRSANINVH